MQSSLAKVSSDRKTSDIGLKKRRQLFLSTSIAMMYMFKKRVAKVGTKKKQVH